MSAALKTNADARLMSKTKYAPELSQKVDMTKVNKPVIKKWVSNEIARILNGEDDVVTEMIYEMLESSKSPDIKQLQINLGGFLDKDAPSFCLELWKLCLSAQANPQGIPKELLEAKKMELIEEKLAEDKAREEAAKRQAAERERERELDRIRERERGQRGRGGRGGRRGRDRSYDRRPPSRDSRSPPRHRFSPRTPQTIAFLRPPVTVAIQIASAQTPTSKHFFRPVTLASHAQKRDGSPERAGSQGHGDFSRSSSETTLTNAQKTPTVPVQLPRRLYASPTTQPSLAIKLPITSRPARTPRGLYVSLAAR